MKIIKRTRGKKGFTLVELVIYMGLMSIMLMVLSSIFVSALDLKLESQTVSATTQDGRYALARLSYDMRRAQEIVAPATRGEQGTVLEIVIDGVSHSYSVADGVLGVTSTGGTVALTGAESTVSDFAVRRLGNDAGKHTVQVSFTLTGGSDVKNFQTTIGLRQ